MELILVPAAALTATTLLLALLVRGVGALRGRRSPGFFRRTLAWHAGLFVLHTFLTVPAVIGCLFPRWLIGTRHDERGWRGPRIAADGKWLIQSRDTLWAEANDDAARERLDPALDEAAARRAVTLIARDGVKLRAFLVPPAGELEPRFDALLVHGLYRSGLELEAVASILRDLGGRVLLLELRNHGGSARARATYGRDERLDVLAGADFLAGGAATAGTPQGSRRERPLLLFAVSLGTAAAVLAVPEIAPLSGLVLDAPIDDLRATADRLLASGGRRGGGVPQPFRALLLFAAEHLGGIPFDDVKPIETAKRLPRSLPVLVIGAGHDFRSPPERVRAFFDALPTDPARKELWIVDEAEHGKVWITAPEEYRARLTRFVERISATPDAR